MKTSVEVMTKLLHTQTIYFLAVRNNLFISVPNYTQGVIFPTENSCAKMFEICGKPCQGFLYFSRKYQISFAINYFIVCLF